MLLLHVLLTRHNLLNMNFEAPPIFDNDYRHYVDAIGTLGLDEFLKETEKRYFYWSEFKHRKNPISENPLEAWKVVKAYRNLNGKKLYFGRHAFIYNLTSYIQQDLHHFDLKLMGGLYKNSITQQDQEEYFKNSLLEEAIASSQIEGAATTTHVARDMIKSGRRPRNESEQMIVNNYNAIREIETRLDETLSTGLILDIHQLMTTKTSANIYAGKFRDHPIYVTDHIDGEVAFTAPDENEVEGLISSLLHFINDDDDFVHPIIKASVLHFIFGYIHPFGDGNGRTARALFYWYLIKKGYALLKHISISKAILDSRVNYDKAFLKTEHDGNDLTYFIMYSMKSLRVAFQNLVNFRDKKRAEQQQASKVMYDLVKKGYNKRQADLLGYLFVKPNANISIGDFAEKHDIVRQTASKDLQDLEQRGFLTKFKDGKNLFYRLNNKEMIKNII